MSYYNKVLLVNDIKLSVNASHKEAFSIAKKRIGKAVAKFTDLSFSVYRRSIDARKKDDVKFVYSISVTGEFSGINPLALAEHSVVILDDDNNENNFIPEHGKEKLSSRPVIVGSGPCGLFSALLLAEEGYAPIIVERGDCISERKRRVNIFNQTHAFDSETNIQFGAGGAGTFSDGKLVTRVNDPLTSYVLRRFVEFGAPKEIQYIAKPHVGTDVLSVVVDNMLSHITKLGGTVLYNTKFLYAKEGKENIAVTEHGDIPFGALILSIGHSARDTYYNLLKSEYAIEPKAFSVGMRIEHIADNIDKALYGDFAGHPKLGHAEYNLSHNTKSRGVYTFCMCPGGEVVAATSEEFGTVVNGMSYHKRDGKNSNSAVVCSIFKEDYGATPSAAIEFQRNIERAAFVAGGSNYAAPIITVGDFLKNECKRSPYDVFPTYMDGKHIRIASPKTYLPEFVCDSISNAITAFDKKIKGFAHDGAILTGAETRTSAPIRILRDPKTRLAVGHPYVYPAGEGAGYAGGITSAAIDGIRTAISIIERFNPEIDG